MRKLAATYPTAPVVRIQPCHWFVGMCLAASLIATGAAAQTDLYQGLNLMERRAVDEVLDEFDLVLDLAPDGKRFGRTIIVNQDVFPDPSSWLHWMNVLHVTTRPQVITEEALWREGDPFDPEIVWETIRNLRLRPTMSIVAMVPVVSDRPDRTTDILVVTRDVWTLRPGFDISSSGGSLDYLQLLLYEHNLLGRNKLIELSTLWEQDTVSAGITYEDPHLAGSRFELLQTFNLIINHDTGAVEGTDNETTFGLPLYQRTRRWGFLIEETHTFDIDRTFIGGALRAYDNPDTEEVEAIPFEVERREVDAQAVALAALGYYNRHEFSFGYGLSYRHYELVGDQIDESARAAFARDVLPRSEFASFLNARYRFFRSQYATVGNFNTFAFSEDLRVGHDLDLLINFAPSLLGSDRDFVEISLLAGYAFVSSDWIFKSSIEGGGRWDIDENDLIDRFIGGNLILATPSVASLSLHLGGEVTLRFNRVTEPLESIGGSDGLRGFSSGFLVGDSRFKGHAELRTDPLEVLSMFWGLLLFFDIGSAFNEDRPVELLSDAGLGLRLVIPALQKEAIRIDYAFPINGLDRHWPGVLTFGFEHVFGEWEPEEDEEE